MNKTLSSWKEIALFLGKGVRTVQRWERTMGLPVHRPLGAPSNVVLARTDDLEKWMQRGSAARSSLVESGHSDFDIDSLEQAVGRLQQQVSTLAKGLGYSFEDGALPKAAVARIEALTAVLRQVSGEAGSNHIDRAA